MEHKVVGFLPYLNVRPLIRPLEMRPPEGYEFIYDTPSGLAQKLKDGDCSIAFVSSFAALGDPGLVILPGAGVGSDGPVESVLLFSRKPFRDIRQVALDTSSLSGAALTRILLEDYILARDVEFVRHAPQASAMLQAADACLLIGNNALCSPPEVPYVLDVAEGWKALTGLPFVFGVWAGRRGCVDDRDVQIFVEAKAQGQRQTEEIVAEESPRLDLPPETIRHYLTQTLIYDLGPRQMAAMDEFARRSSAHGLLPEDACMRLFEPTPQTPAGGLTRG